MSSYLFLITVPGYALHLVVAGILADCIAKISVILHLTDVGGERSSLMMLQIVPNFQGTIQFLKINALKKKT